MPIKESINIILRQCSFVRCLVRIRGGPSRDTTGKERTSFRKTLWSSVRLLFFFSSSNTRAFSPNDQFPASVIRETQFESVQLQPEEIPAPLPQETSEPESGGTKRRPDDSCTDQPGNIQRGAGQQLGGTSDPNDTVLDPIRSVIS